MLPQDPVMLLSYINLKLRDDYENLEQLCSDLEIDQNMIIQKLATIDYVYNIAVNQFK